MSLTHKLKHEISALMLAALYFLAWIGGLLVLKHLLLAEYHIATYGYSAALIGALILSKVVLIFERVPLGQWVRARPAWVDIVLRTMVYGAGVILVMALERGIRERHEYGGFAEAVKAAFLHADIPHVWVNAFCITAALLGYNLLALVRRHLGEGALLKMLLTPMPELKKGSR